MTIRCCRHGDLCCSDVTGGEKNPRAIDPLAHRDSHHRGGGHRLLGSADAGPDRKAIQRDIPLSDSDFGNLQSLFYFAYALMYVGGGRLMDLLGTRRGFLLIVVWWSLAMRRPWSGRRVG